jgi:hypothetical protein
VLAWLETVPSVLGTCGYWESQPSLQKCDLGASIMRNKACGLIAGLALILPACCSVRVPMLICAASALTPRAAMADLVLSFLFEHQYRYIPEWMALMTEAKTCERQIHNLIWLVASGPFEVQFTVPECQCASDWFWSSDAREVLALMAASQRLAACGYSLGIRPTMLRYALTPTWMPNPFEWETFQEHMAGTLVAMDWPQDLTSFVDECEDHIELLGRHLSNWKVRVWRTAKLWRLGWNQPLWFRG